MQNNRRQFYIYDLEVAARKAGATPPPMSDVIAVMSRMHAASRTYTIRTNTGTLLIGDLAVNVPQNYAVLLVRLSDKLTPNSVYSDPAAGRFDEHVKNGNVGSDFGCHVIISLLPEQNIPNIYTCAVERVPGLPPELVRRMLSKFLTFEYDEDPASFSYPNPAGGLTRGGLPRMERCLPHVEMRGRPSDSLIDDINAGRLSGVSLVKSEVVAPIAGAAYLRKSTSELKLDVDHNALPAQLWDSLRAALHRNARVYPTAKVSYRVPGESRTVTVEIDAVTGAPLNDLYVKSFELNNIFPFLAQSARQIVPHLRDLAVPQFIANRTI